MGNPGVKREEGFKRLLSKGVTEGELEHLREKCFQRMMNWSLAQCHTPFHSLEVPLEG